MTEKCLLPSDVLKIDDDLLKSVKQDIVLIKELFNFSTESTNRDIILTDFNHYLKNSNHGHMYFLTLINHYAKVRPLQGDLVKSLIQLIKEHFTENSRDIENFFQFSRSFLAHFSQHKISLTDDQQLSREVLMLIMDDNVDGLINFIVMHPLFNVFEQHLIDEYYCSLTKIYVETSSNTKQSFLVFCSLFGAVKCFKYLFLNKCEITNSVCEMAIAGRNKEIVNILQEKGYDFSQYLPIAIGYHSYELTDWLIKKKNYIYVRFRHSIQFFNFETFVYFMRNNSILNYSDFSSDILHTSLFIGHLPLVQYLFNFTKDNSFDSVFGSFRQQPIHIACIFGHLNILRYLVEEKGVPVDQKDLTEKTPLHYACENDHISIVQYLIEKGANVNSQDQNKSTPLMNAIIHGHFPTVEYLIEKCAADINLSNTQNYSPLHYATLFGKNQIVEYLLSKGANRHVKNTSGQTPSDFIHTQDIKDIFNSFPE